MNHKEENMSEVTCHCVVEQMIFQDGSHCKSWRAISPDADECRQLEAYIVAEWVKPSFRDSRNTVGYCPKCGARLGFTEDGQPTEEPR